MPKSMVISPEEVRRPGNLEIDPIPLNRYQPDIAAERERWGDAALLGAYRDMMLIRQFERMLDSVKTTGGYAGVDYVHEGPRTCRSARKPPWSDSVCRSPART